MELQPGMVGEVRRAVDPGMTASAYGNPDVHVLATPALIALLEEAGAAAIAPGLSPEERSLGTHLDVRHLAATPAGMLVTARATLVEVDGRRLRFELEASDERETIGEGRMERFVVDITRFLAKVSQKTSAG